MNNRRRGMIGLLVLISILMIVGLGGCQQKKSLQSKYSIYYVEQTKKSLSGEALETETTDPEKLVYEIADLILGEPSDPDHRHIAPDSVKLENVTYTNNVVYLYFSEEYEKDMSPEEEIVCRGAIAQDFLQISDVRGILIYVDGVPLQDAGGKNVGLIQADSFVINPGKEIDTMKETDLVLYFASSTGESLVSEKRHVLYASNISMEKLVMECLLEGPSSADTRRAMPQNTGLISVSVMDGVCFVNLDDNFLVQDFVINEDVVIYSIVNSLTELSTVDTVQISVNGKTDIVYRDKYDLNQYYEQNPYLVTGEVDEVGEDVLVQEGE